MVNANIMKYNPEHYRMRSHEISTGKLHHMGGVEKHRVGPKTRRTSQESSGKVVAAVC